MQDLAVSRFADRDSQEVRGYLETLQNVSIVLKPYLASKYSKKNTLHKGKYKHGENLVEYLQSQLPGCQSNV